MASFPTPPPQPSTLQGQGARMTPSEEPRILLHEGRRQACPCTHHHACKPHSMPRSCNAPPPHAQTLRPKPAETRQGLSECSAGASLSWQVPSLISNDTNAQARPSETSQKTQWKGKLILVQQNFKICSFFFIMYIFHSLFEDLLHAWVSKIFCSKI